jgi:hypothetical protein
MYPAKTIERMLSGEKNDRNGTGSWWMCPVCGNGDDEDPEPGMGWSCWSCDPEAEGVGPRGMATRDDRPESVKDWTDETRMGYEVYPSCAMGTAEDEGIGPGWTVWGEW